MMILGILNFDILTITVSKHRRMSKSKLTLLLEEEENKNDSKRDEKKI